MQWRDEQPGIARKVVTGAALAALSIVCLIDAVASLAFAILTSPALLFGSNTPSLLLDRAIMNGLISLAGISIVQYDNIFSEQLVKSSKERLEKFAE